MANETNNTKSTPGGVVSLQSIIDQIASIGKGMEAVIDAVITSTNSSSVAKKAAQAKKDLKRNAEILSDLVTTIQESVNEVFKDIDVDKINEDFSKLITDPKALAEAANGKYDGILQKMGKKAGLLEVLCGMISVVNIIGNLDMPNPAGIYIKSFLLRLSMKALANQLPKIITDMDNISTILTEHNMGDRTKEGIALANFAQELDNISNIIGCIRDVAFMLPVVLISMPMAKTTINILSTGVPAIMTSADAMYKSIDGRKEYTKKVLVINNMLGGILSIAKSISWIALITPLMIIAIPVAVIGVIAMSLGIRAILAVLRILGSPAMIKAANIIITGVKRLLRKILKCIIIIAQVLAAIVLIVVICAMLAPLLLSSFIPFLLSMIIFMGVFMTLRLVFWVMAKLANSAAIMSAKVLLNVLIIAGVLLILALVMMVLAFTSKIVNSQILEIALLMGFLMVVLVAITGFMTLAGVLSPAIVAGTVAVVALMTGIVCIMLLVGLLLMMTYIADLLDPAKVKEAVNKVIDSVSDALRALFNAKFSDPESSNTGGLLGGIAYLIGGQFLNNVLTLIMKVAILFVAIFAFAAIILLVTTLIGIVKLYNSNKQTILLAPKIVSSVMKSCVDVIRTILNADMTGPGKTDGAFMALASWVFGKDMVNIFKLLFRVVIVMLTIVVLAMVRFLMGELLWISSFWKKKGTEIQKVPSMITEIMDVCSEIIQKVITSGTGISFEAADGAFMKIVSFVSPDLTSIVSLLFRVLIIGLTMAVLAMVKLLMDELQWIYKAYNSMGGAKMISNIKSMVDDIITSINSIINTISTAGADPNGKPRAGLSGLLRWLGMDTLATVIDLMCAFSMVGLAMVGMSVLMGVAKMMHDTYTMYQELGGDKIVTNVRKMTLGLGDAINSILSALTEIHITVPEGAKAPSWTEAASVIFGNWVRDIAALFGIAGDIEKAIPVMTVLCGISRAMSITTDSISKNLKKGQFDTVTSGLINQLKSTVEIINNSDLDELETLDTNLHNIEATLTHISNTFNRLLGATGNQKVFDTLLKKADKYSKVVVDTDKLVNRVNGLDINKMNALAKMFGNAAAFSQSINGNFDRLADVIREKIEPLIRGLKEAIESADRTIKEKAANELKIAEARKAEAASKAEAAKADLQKSQLQQPAKPTTIPINQAASKPVIQKQQPVQKKSTHHGLAGEIADALADTILKVKVT